MRVLLPPSETKRDGGDSNLPLDLTRLSFPALSPQRTSAIMAVKSLSRNPTTMATALRLGQGRTRELGWNRTVTTSATMPAIERFTGVLFDAIDVSTLDERARRFASNTVVIASALFGIVGAEDPVPAYRLSHDSRLPAVKLRQLWAGPIAGELDRMPHLVLDLRSDAYAALGPLPTGRPGGVDRERYASVRVVAEDADGARRALTHVNKKGKGVLVRRIVEAGIEHRDVASLLSWAEGVGIRLTRRSPGVLDLTVDEVARGDVTRPASTRPDGRRPNPPTA